MECEMQWPPDISSEGCKGQQEPPLGDTASLQWMADALVRGYFAEQAMLLAHEEEVRAATEVQVHIPMVVEMQGPTDTSSEECGGQQGPPSAEPQGDAGEQWLRWHSRKKRRQSECAGATLPSPHTVLDPACDAGAQWLHWNAQRLGQKPKPRGGVL